MLRSIAIITTIAVTFAMLGAFAHERASRTAYACAFDPPTTSDLVRRAAFVGVVEVRAVGDDINREPRLTPSVTPSPDRSQTPVQSPTAHSYLDFSSPTNTNTPLPASTPEPHRDMRLEGLGATLRVMQSIDGAAPAEFDIDAESRAKFERDLRREAAGFISDCRFPPPQYETGSTYLIIANITPVGGSGFYTMLRFRLDRSELILGQSGQLGEYLSMSRSDYAAYFAGAPILADLPSEVPYVLITADRVPLAQFVRFVQGVRRRGIVTPPETGSAGLAAQR